MKAVRNSGFLLLGKGHLGQSGGDGTQLPRSPPCLFLRGLNPRGSQPACNWRRTSTHRCWVLSSCRKPMSEMGIPTSRSSGDLKAFLWHSQLTRGCCHLLTEPSTPLALVHLRQREMSLLYKESKQSKTSVPKTSAEHAKFWHGLCRTARLEML